jgi:hypothetical protein
MCYVSVAFAQIGGRINRRQFENDVDFRSVHIEITFDSYLDDFLKYEQIATPVHLY